MLDVQGWPINKLNNKLISLEFCQSLIPFAGHIFKIACLGYFECLVVHQYKDTFATEFYSTDMVTKFNEGNDVRFLTTNKAKGKQLWSISSTFVEVNNVVAFAADDDDDHFP